MGTTKAARAPKTPRTKIPDRVRFEVFKRDGFTCVYCGARPPGVVLHADHVVPVAEGGADDIDNLVTACATCNGGKGAVPLSAAAQAHTRQASLDRAREVAAIDAAYNNWLREQRVAKEAAVARLAAHWRDGIERNGYGLSESSLVSVRYFLGSMLEEEVYQAMNTAYYKIPVGDFDPKWKKDGMKYRAVLGQMDRRIRYFFGVCHNTIRRRKEAATQ